MDNGELWNCAGSSLQALALSPRNELTSTSPMISPRTSPRLVRRSSNTANPVCPPPLPPKRGSPTLEQLTISSLSNLRPRKADVCSSQMSLDEAQSASQAHAYELSEISKSNSMQDIYAEMTDSDPTSSLELSAPETIYGIVDSDNDNCDLSAIYQVPPRHKAAAKFCSKIESSRPDEPSYENIQLAAPKRNVLCALASKEASAVSYENLNMDYIKKLVSEGYSRDAVIRALGITRNNIDMACDILHEFGTKHA